MQEGCFAGFSGIIAGSVRAVWQLYAQPDKYARSSGAMGCIFGFVVAAFVMARDILLAVLVFFDRICTGFANGCCGKDYDYMFDPSRKTPVYQHNIIEAQVESIVMKGISPARRTDLLKTLDVTVNARVIFEMAGPCKLDENNRHFLTVKLSELREVILDQKSLLRLKLSQREASNVIERLEKLGDVPPPALQRRLQKLEKPKNLSMSSIEEADNEEPEVSGENLINVSFSLFLKALSPSLAPQVLEASNNTRGSMIIANSLRGTNDFSKYLT